MSSVFSGPVRVLIEHERKVRVAIVGVGNCASALVQGVDYYRGVGDNEAIAGLMHVRLGKYHVDDIEFTSAFDVNATKVGFNLAEAIYAEPNNTHRFARAKMNGVTVMRGPTLDGLGKYAGAMIEESGAAPVNIAEMLSAPAPTCWFPICRLARKRPPNSMPKKR